MICGASGGIGGTFEHKNFPYRSSSYLTEFFSNCGLDYVHDGTTRRSWVLDVRRELNNGSASSPQLPPDRIIRVIEELMDPGEFRQERFDRSAALADLNESIGRDGLQAYLDNCGRVLITNVGTHTTSAELQPHRRQWTAAEMERKTRIASYLDDITEDELIEHVLVPLFSQLGFARVSATGHTDKALEYGRDLWMKYQLPTGHLLYFGVQAKRAKIDAASRSGSANISEVLTQVKMMLANPIWDPDTNRQNLLDHVYIACAREITKQARSWLGQHLDQESRRHIMFLDRNDLLHLTLGIDLPGLCEAEEGKDSNSHDLPF